MARRGFRRTFRETVGHEADVNAERLMRRARLANRIAKSSEGRARRAAYRVKAAALVGLRERFPHRVELEADPLLPTFVIVRVTDSRFGLHAPAELFGVEGGLSCAA